MSRTIRRGPLVGALAAVVAVGGMLLLGVITEQPTIAETIADGITRVTPIQLIERMTATLGDGAKHLLFGSILLGEVGLGAAAGALDRRLHLTGATRGLSLAGLVLAVGFVALPALGLGVFGSTGQAGTVATMASLAATAAVFALAYRVNDALLNPGGVFAVEEASSRRAFLRRALLTLGSVALGVGGIRWAAERLTPATGGSVSAEATLTNAALAGAGDLVEAIARGVPGLASEITPNERFYVVSKNVLRDPTVSEESWRLEITGLVDRPVALSYTELKALPAASQYFTLQCISNEVGGELIGNAQWRGVGLSSLLQEAGVKPNAADVVLHAADEYTDSIPLAKAMEPGAMVAFEMNGEPLPRAHGFPARLLVPDIYGMKNVKWLTRIEVVEYDFRGYWQTKGWDDGAIMHTTSRIDLPKNRSNLAAGENFAGGVAVAGSRGIRQVEVSTDGGGSWSFATIKPALGPNTWVVWLHRWELPAGDAAERRILVRATDGLGAVQSAELRESFPEGSSGYHAVTVRQASS